MLNCTQFCWSEIQFAVDGETKLVVSLSEFSPFIMLSKASSALLVLRGRGMAMIIAQRCLALVWHNAVYGKLTSHAQHLGSCLHPG